MAGISVLVPQRNAGALVAAQIPAICAALEPVTSTYELIVMDDASQAECRSRLADCARHDPRVRVLSFTPACGLSAALSAGLAEAKGDIIVTLPAGDSAVGALLQLLLDALARVDLVVGRPHRHGVRKLFHRLGRIPRWLLLGLEVRDPECLVWAARREAVAGVELPCGMYRYLATLVAARGFRVGEITVPTPGRSVTLSDGWPNPGDLLAAWWFKRRWRQYEHVELIQSR